jgi:tellurite resistance protein TerC
MLFDRDAKLDFEKNFFMRLCRKMLPLTQEFHGRRFIIRLDGRVMFTPLLLVLILVDVMDLIFAVDSIPAVFGVTKIPFIVFTSNVFAILGLRSLYFVLAGLINYFRYLKVGLSAVLIFIGIKMLIDPGESEPKWFQYDIPTSTSLIVVATIILLSMLASVISAQREKKRKEKPSDDKKPPVDNKS